MLVTLPEETPVNELIDTAYAIEDRVGVALGPIVVNSCVAPMIGIADDDPIDADRVQSDAALAGVELRQGEAAALADAQAFRLAQRRREAAQCARLAQRLPLPQIPLPFAFTADIGPQQIEMLADALAAGVRELPDLSRR